MSGAFIVVEGADGVGKGTQLPMLVDRLRAEGREVVATFEPGATSLGRTLREVLLERDAVDPVAEALLMAADRAQHLAEVVRPALARDAVVVCDRFLPSSLVYQGVARGLGVELIDELNAPAVQATPPDLVVVLDVPDAVADARRVADDDRFEREADTFHRQVRQAYRDLAAARGWVVIDGQGTPVAVHARVWEVVAVIASG
ncbi:MAG: dTMP kinase [Acidimicrobiia bacterium]